MGFFRGVTFCTARSRAVAAAAAARGPPSSRHEATTRTNNAVVEDVHIIAMFFQPSNVSVITEEGQFSEGAAGVVFFCEERLFDAPYRKSGFSLRYNTNGARGGQTCGVGCGVWGVWCGVWGVGCVALFYL